MNTPDISDIPGATQMTLLEMNDVHFDKLHTVLTPELLDKLKDGGSGGAQQTPPEP